jgi:hypothetical protein
MEPAPTAQAVAPLIEHTFEGYLRRRLAFYRDPEATLRKLLTKDVLMYALRGVTTADEFVVAAFAAYESSSEETMWGLAWQEAIANASPNTVGGGDLRTERDGTLWIIQVKSSIAQNSGAKANDLLLLRSKLLDERDQHPGRRSVKPMLGIIRGPERDQWVTHRARNKAYSLIDGFQYQYLVGPAFLRWVSAEFDPVALAERFAPLAAAIRGAREEHIAGVQTELRKRLAAAGLSDAITSLLSVPPEVPGAAGKRR